MRCWKVAIALGLLSWSSISYAADLKPIKIPPSTEWLGFDGDWSPLLVRVGTPPQWISVLPSTLGLDTWVIGASGCDETPACISKRGGIFKSNLSSTWQGLGPFLLNFQTDLGVNGSADYGLDRIAIEEKISVPEQIIGIINNTDFLTGSLGLGVTPSNFTYTSQPTFLNSLVNNESAIPSHSYGYTAGAHYRLKKVPSSLTLGGVDLNRFTPNQISFDLASGFVPIVAIDAISLVSDPLSTSVTKPDWAGQPLTLQESSQAELFTLDSSTPFLWLPEKVCDAFAQALNLEYDEGLQLYLYKNETDPSTLADWNMTFTFTIADLPGSSKAVNITLPYAAFDHQLTFPFPALNATVSSLPVKYFPLRKAASEAQYTIGRVFFQEAYLTVDYERNNLSISQAKFANDAVTNVDLTAIHKPDNGGLLDPSTGSGRALSPGAIAGIGTGGAILIFLILGLVVYLCLRRKRRTGAYGYRFLKAKHDEKPAKPSTAEEVELAADKHHPSEVAADKTCSRFELSGDSPAEMPAEIPTSYFVVDKTRRGLTPAELEGRDSMSKDSMPLSASRSPRSSLLPPYSPAQVGRSSGSNVSPSSTLFPDSSTRGSRAISSTSGTHPDESDPRQDCPDGRRGAGRETCDGSVISPCEPSPLLRRTHSGNLLGRTNLNVWEPKKVDEETPSRTVSRSSRFQEEGIANANPPPPGSQPQRRFSFDRDV